MENLEELERELRRLLGLNKYEARLYLAFLSGSKNPKEASEKSGVPLPRVYDTAATLARKGLLVKMDKWYSPLPPDTVFKMIASEVMREAMERADSLRVLGDKLLQAYPPSGSPREEFLVIRGLSKTISFSTMLLSRSKRAVFTLWKALDNLDLLLPLIEPVIKLLRERETLLILPSYAQLGDEEKKTVMDMGARLCFTDCLMLDSLILDGREVIIGVPDPSAEKEVISLYIKSEGFAEALEKSILKKTECPHNTYRENK